MGPCQQTEIPVHGLSTPLKLTFNICTLPEDKEVICSYFKETKKAWVTDGMNAVEPVDGSLICESTHATYFAPSSREIKNGTSNTTATESLASTAVRGKILAALLSPYWRDIFHWIFKSLSDYFGHNSIDYTLVLHYAHLGR